MITQAPPSLGAPSASSTAWRPPTRATRRARARVGAAADARAPVRRAWHTGGERRALPSCRRHRWLPDGLENAACDPSARGAARRPARARARVLTLRVRGGGEVRIAAAPARLGRDPLAEVTLRDPSVSAAARPASCGDGSPTPRPASSSRIADARGGLRVGGAQLGGRASLCAARPEPSSSAWDGDDRAATGLPRWPRRRSSCCAACPASTVRPRRRSWVADPLDLALVMPGRRRAQKRSELRDRRGAARAAPPALPVRVGGHFIGAGCDLHARRSSWSFRQDRRALPSRFCDVRASAAARRAHPICSARRITPSASAIRPPPRRALRACSSSDTQRTPAPACGFHAPSWPRARRAAARAALDAVREPSSSKRRPISCPTSIARLRGARRGRRCFRARPSTVGSGSWPTTLMTSRPRARLGRSALRPAAPRAAGAGETLVSPEGLETALRYRLRRELLGRGATAAVTCFSPPTRTLGIDVALKILHPQLAGAAPADARRRFFAEGRGVAAAFRHPGVIAIYDLDERDAGPRHGVRRVAGNAARPPGGSRGRRPARGRTSSWRQRAVIAGRARPRPRARRDPRRSQAREPVAAARARHRRPGRLRRPRPATTRRRLERRPRPAHRSTLSPERLRGARPSGAIELRSLRGRGRGSCGKWPLVAPCARTPTSLGGATDTPALPSSATAGAPRPLIAALAAFDPVPPVQARRKTPSITSRNERPILHSQLAGTRLRRAGERGRGGTRGGRSRIAL